MNKSFTNELADFMSGNSSSYLLKELVDILFKEFPHRSKAYIKVFIQKCTVNNPNRVSLGAGGDIFVLLDGKYSAYTNAYTGPIYTYDVERARAAKAVADVKTSERIESFKNMFKGSTFKIHPQQSKILVISQCTKDKSLTPCSAIDMYTGMHHKYIKDVAKHFDLYIISAGYGLIHSSTVIEPYDITFNDLHKTDLPKLAGTLDIRSDLEYLLSNTSYDLMVLAVSDMYLEIFKSKKTL